MQGIQNYSNEVIVYSLDLGEEGEVPLLETIDDMAHYFDIGEKDFPGAFTFPSSYQYDLTFGMVTRSNKQ